jgi:hypothetical protein
MCVYSLIVVTIAFYWLNGLDTWCQMRNSHIASQWWCVNWAIVRHYIHVHVYKIQHHTSIKKIYSAWTWEEKQYNIMVIIIISVTTDVPLHAQSSRDIFPRHLLAARRLRPSPSSIWLTPQHCERYTSLPSCADLMLSFQHLKAGSAGLNCTDGVTSPILV